MTNRVERLEALRLAALPQLAVTDANPSDTVTRAEAFLNFLLGSPSKKTATRKKLVKVRGRR